MTHNEGDIAWAGIGQYNDLVTPLHAAMIAGAVANDGVMMEPKLLKDVARGGYAGFSFSAAQYKRVLSPEIAAKVKGYMRDVVTGGTGTSAGVSGLKFAEKRARLNLWKTAKSRTIPGLWALSMIALSPMPWLSSSRARVSAPVCGAHGRQDFWLSGEIRK